LLPREDPDVAGELSNILREDGIELLLETQPLRVEGTNDGRILLTAGTPDGERAVSGSHLLVAAGRVPNTGRLNLGAAGIQVNERGFVPVNERLETTVPGVYALGDVNGGPAFTHISYDDYRVIRAELLGGAQTTTSRHLVPYVLFIDPQLGRVGLTEKEAQAQGFNYRVAKIPMSWVARGLETDEARGLVKAIVDADTGQILGAAVLGIEGGEVMTVVQMAMMGGVPYTTLRDGVFAHPTLAEALNTLFASVDG
jgi:pyruvate/2-oxoglutarate dehydrogenase complex dihydrolipoamide dehydrogenase (E3) component